MKKLWILVCIALLLALPAAASAAEDLVLRGSGLRTKLILGAMYELALHVPASLKDADAQTLIESDQPMELVLTLKSSMITRARFVETTSGGFAKAAQSGYVSDQTQAFLDQFAATEFRKGDVIAMGFADGQLVTRYRVAASKGSEATETTLGQIPGLDLKKALLAIWLGNTPAQESLKKDLLSGKAAPAR